MKSRPGRVPRDRTVDDIGRVEEPARDEQVQGVGVVQGKVPALRDPEEAEGILITGGITGSHGIEISGTNALDSARLF